MPLGSARLTLFAKPTVAVEAEVIRKKVGVSAEGNAQVDTAQSKFGGASAVFDGTGDYLDCNSAIDFGTGDFTIEFWVYPDVLTSTRLLFDGRVSGTQVIPVLYTNGTTLYYYVTANRITATSALTTGTWQHIAVSRSSGTTKLFVDGTQVGSSYSDSNNYISFNPYIGLYKPTSTSPYDGNIDEVRISNTARYTTGFTPSTAPFTNDDNTLLLLHMDGTDGSTFFEDDNGVREKVGVVGLGAEIDTAQYKFGGASALFGGNFSADKIGVYTDVINVGTGDYTIEGWFRPTSGEANGILFDFRPSGSGTDLNYPSLSIDDETDVKIRIDNVDVISDDAVVTHDAWNHIAYSRNSGTGKLFVNGTQVGSSYSDSFDMTGLTKFGIGDALFSGGGSADYGGHIDEIRVSDSARYTGAFTAPTAPFVNDSNTLLLLHMDGTDADTDFRDDNGTGRSSVGVSAVNNAQVDTAQYKFGGASAYFDGTNDYLSIGDSSASGTGTGVIPTTGEFTIEGWVRYSTVNSSYRCLISQYGYNGQANPVGRSALFLRNNDKFSFFINGASSIDGTTTPVQDTWYHIAATRNSAGRVDLWVNGVSENNFTSSAPIVDSYTTIGALSNNQDFDMLGWIDEVRVSNIARYTSTFTPQTEPFQNDANTLLLLHMDGTDGSTVFIDDNGKQS